MLYLDANVFIHPALYDDAKAKFAAALLDQVKRGRERAVTSALTIDEVVYIIQKHAGRDSALRAARAILAFPNLSVVPATADEILSALDLIEHPPHPQPRDAIHAATALKHEAAAVVSDEAIFAKIPGLKHRALAK